MYSDGNAKRKRRARIIPLIFQPSAMGVTAQAERVYNTYTDASNGEWGTFDSDDDTQCPDDWNGGEWNGTARGIIFNTNGSLVMDLGVRWRVGSRRPTIYQLALPGVTTFMPVQQ